HKYPLRPAVHRYTCIHPFVEPGNIQRLVPSQRTAVQSRPWQSKPPPSPVEDERTCNQNGQRRRPCHAQSRARVVSPPPVQPPATFIYGIDLCYLRLVWSRRQSKVCITASLSQNLELGINAATTATRGVAEREVPMDESIHGRRCGHQARQALVLARQKISEFNERAAKVLCSVGKPDAVVEMDFYLPTPFELQLCKQVQ